MKMKTTPNQKARAAILTPDKIDFQTKARTRDKKDPASALLGLYPKKLRTLN